jgi:hypothetical protein
MNDERKPMSPEQLDEWVSSHHAHPQNDDHGRRDLNGGIGYVLIAALICLPLIAALIWRIG